MGCGCPSTSSGCGPSATQRAVFAPSLPTFDLDPIALRPARSPEAAALRWSLQRVVDLLIEGVSRRIVGQSGDFSRRERTAVRPGRRRARREPSLPTADPLLEVAEVAIAALRSAWDTPSGPGDAIVLVVRDAQSAISEIAEAAAWLASYQGSAPTNEADSVGWVVLDELRDRLHALLSRPTVAVAP
jgi:hypothetical protein